MFVVSRGSATQTRSLTLNIPSCWRSRSSTLEVPGSHSCLLFLVMFSHRELVAPAIVRICMYLVYCTGGPPPEIVSCAGAFYSWRHLAFCHYYCQCTVAVSCVAVHVQVHVQVHVHVMCRCSAGAGAWAVRVQLQVMCGVCECTRYIFVSFFFTRVYCTISFLCNGFCVHF